MDYWAQLAMGSKYGTSVYPDPKKMEFIRLKINYDGVFGNGTFYIIISLDGRLEIQFKSTADGETLIKALTFTLLEGNEEDGKFEKLSFKEKKVLEKIIRCK